MRPIAAAAGFIALLLGGCAGSPRADETTAKVSSAPPLDRFCADVQHYMAGTTLPVVNAVHADYDAFVLSKAQVRPLRTEQYAWYENESRARVQMISCKMKTSDHLRTEYGTAQSTGEQTCSGYNARTLARLLEALPADARAALKFDAGRDVIFEDDEITPMGPVWLAPYPMARVDETGALRIKAKAMRNDWLDPRLAKTPERFRGTRYCHLVAPEYLARVLTGAAAVGAYAVPAEALKTAEIPTTPPSIPGVPDSAR